jgi:hypothetical protein
MCGQVSNEEIASMEWLTHLSGEVSGRCELRYRQWGALSSYHEA